MQDKLSSMDGETPSTSGTREHSSRYHIQISFLYLFCIFNEEREVFGRQKVVCEPSVPVLTSHAGLNPRPYTTLSLAASLVSDKKPLGNDSGKAGELSEVGCGLQSIDDILCRQKFCRHFFAKNFLPPKIPAY